MVANIFIFLSCLGLGWFVDGFCSRRACRFRNPIECYATAMILGVTLVIVVEMRLRYAFGLAISGMAELRSSSSCDRAICLLGAVVIDFLPAVGVGAILSSWASLSTQLPRWWRAWRLGIIPSVIIGTFSGLLLGTRWLIPLFGILSTTTIALLLLILTGFLMIARNGRRHPISIVLLALSGMILAEFGEVHSREYLYGQPHEDRDGSLCRYFKVGQFGDVRVDENHGGGSLEMDGLVIGSTVGNCAGEIGLACIPRFVRPRSERILSFGLSTGMECSMSAQLGLKELVCVEKDPAIIEAEKAFPEIHKAFNESKCIGLRRADWEAALAADGLHYDVILVNNGNLAVAEARETLTRAFLSKAKLKLKPNGIFGHLLNLSSISPEGLGLVARTIAASFPHCALVRVSAFDALLLASETPIVPSADVMSVAEELLISKPTVRNVLARQFGATNVSQFLLRQLWLGEDGLRRLAERDSETSVLGSWMPSVVCGAIPGSSAEEKNCLLINALISASLDQKETETLLNACGRRSRDAGPLGRVSACLMENGQRDAAVKLVTMALAVAPDDPNLLTDELMWSENVDQHVISNATERIAKQSIAAGNRVGIWLWECGRLDEAERVFQQLVGDYPKSATLQCNLATVLQALGKTKESEALFAESRLLDPASDCGDLGVTRSVVNYPLIVSP